MNIKEIMSKPAITCRSYDTLNCAAQLMWEHDCGAIPVVDDAGALVGIVTDRDVCMAAYTKGVPLSAIPVSEAMAKNVFTCHADDSLEAAEQLMANKQVRRVPVVNGDNRPIGILSMNDIARYAAVARKKEGLDGEIAQTLAAICQPRSRAIQARPQGQPLVQQHAATP